jgi:putative membrane protein
MMVSNRGSVFGLLAWQWRNALLFTLAALIAQLLHYVFHWGHLVLPALPVAVVGGAIGIFASFRTNSCYARWWEGRQLWGRLVNTSRTFASQVLTSVPQTEAHALVRRHIAYVHVLRCALREQDLFADPDVVAFTSDEERASLKGDRNAAYALAHTQRVALTKMCDEKVLGEERLLALDQSLAAIVDVQGGCERLKRTPFPRGYAFIAERLILAYGLLLPFAMVKDLGWFVIPINLLVCGAFALISEAGRVLEDPFSTFWNGLPLSALSKTIEINLRQRMGEKEVPPLPVPNAQGILM